MESFNSVQVQTQATSEYSISGADCQVLTIAMKPKAVVIAQPGAFMFSSPGIQTVTRCGSCSRTCVGEALCKNVYTNGSQDGYIALTPSFPAKVVPVDLTTVSNRLIAKAGAYMSHVGDVSLTASFDCCPTTCLFAGMGFGRQDLRGNGTVFLEAGGVVLTKVLAPNETLIVDSDALVAYAPTVKISIQCITDCCMLLYGGEGCFNTTVTGPGLIIVQSMSFDKYKAAVAPPPMPSPSETNENDASKA